MSHLTTEVRADYTGKLVTRHVRADTTKKTALSLPAPVVQDAPSENLLAVENELIFLLESVSSSTNDNEFDEEEEYDDSAASYLDTNALIDAEGLHTALGNLPERTLAMVADKIEAERFSSSQDFKIVMLHALTFNDDDPQLIEYMTEFHKDVDDIYPGDDMLDEGVNSYSILYDCLNGLRHYERLGYVPPESISETTEDQRELAKSLAALRFDVENYSSADRADTGTRLIDADAAYSSNIVSDDDLVRIMLDHRDNSNRVLEIMMERNTRDPELIRSILENPTRSLSEGVL